MVSDKILKFTVYRYVGKYSPAPCRPHFLMNHDDLNNLGRGLQKKFLQRYTKIGPVVSDKKIIKIFYIDI